ncbi:MULTISPECIES: NADH-quinone oxidoreductase subunit L [unclassified Pseudomonas]|uniref:NADH-quinone oxidoreductase subunit L n=1 Tax=unclassified Pseudomonas TaxID=196821 RepID=UPI000DAA121B|nr:MULTISPECIES: NADH-quinone oxidoreductase subunit L [unclassified Pseudomonas]MDW3711155.1 NADH-quinone oxidoreductase subunit L [Pseudomonas sp. 2023EL-01195]PZE14334.1 NADH-quinone oxidoreductase subunit L [Pseudomonas sp. 57B-090624]
MPILSLSLAQLLPWVYALALLPAACIGSPRRVWWPARAAGYLGLTLVAGAWLQAALDGRDNDRLGLAMAGLVGLLAMVITDYSHRYLDGEPGQRRYVLALLGTLAAVATVVTSTDLFLLVGAWILSSLCLHQLLTFYRDRPQAVVVAHKKFLASRLADACMLLATVLLVRASGDSQIAAILQMVDARLQASGQLGWDLQLAALLLALAVILKSAQLPVHGWLIQVMEAPTPVSALLHAGLVNLGGFLLLRFAPLLSAATPAQSLLVLVGGLTAVIAALVMMTRISIKVRLAWSTCAQMGLMLLECGLGLYELALVHLLAHSLYKAHAFLAAGETVAQARHHALHPQTPAPGLARLVLALLLAGAALALLHVLWTWALPGHALPLVALALLAIGLAPWCLRRGQLPYGLAMFTLLLGAYLLWHQAAGWILQQPLAEAPLPLSWLAVLLFLGLYLLQAVILAHPQGAVAQRLYPLAFAGFYLDEHFTRLTFRLWPVRPPQHLPSPYGERP